MKHAYSINQVIGVINRYDADHDIGPDAPVTWREERLAHAILDLNDEIEKIKGQVNALLEAVPSANRKEKS